MTKQPRAAQNIISYHLKQGRSRVGETQVIAWPSAGAGEKSSSKDATSHTTTQTGTPGGSTSAAAESSILLMCTLGCRTRWLKYLCPCHPMGDLVEFQVPEFSIIWVVNQKLEDVSFHLCVCLSLSLCLLFPENLSNTN